MLRVFLLSPDLLSAKVLPGEHVNALDGLFREIFRSASSVCVVLPSRDELEQLFNFVKRFWIDPQRAKLLALIERNLPIGHGLHCLALTDGDAVQRWRRCAEVTRADYSITSARVGGQRDHRYGKHQLKVIAVEDLDSIAEVAEYSFGLCRLPQELDQALGAIVRIRPELTIIEPYLGRNAGLARQDFEFERLAIQKLAVALRETVDLLNAPPRVEVLVSLGKLRVEMRKMGKSAREMSDAETQARLRISGLFESAGIDPKYVRIRLVEEDFTLRAFRCAAKFWRLEHNLLQLGKLIKRLNSRPGVGPQGASHGSRLPILAPWPTESSSECQDLLSRARSRVS